MKSVLLTTIVILLLLPTSGCSTASSLGIPLASGNHSLMSAADGARSGGIPRELEKTVFAPHRIEPGDVVSVEPVDFNSGLQLPGDQTVAADGTIDLGSFGLIRAAGQTAKEIESQVESTIAATIAARSQYAGNAYHTAGLSNAAGPSVGNDVSVRLVAQETDRFYVFGEIMAPGSYPLSGNETVLDALVAAGGLSTKANEHKIILVRPAKPGQKRVVLPVCHQSIVQLGDTSTNFQIYPGDRIFVPSLSLFEDVRQSLTPAKSDRCPHCKIQR